MLIKKLRTTSKKLIGIVGGSLLIAIGSLLANYLWNFNIILAIFALLKKILLFRIPVWIILITGAVMLSLLAIIKRQKQRRQLRWCGFTKMEYQGHVFSWEYTPQSHKPYAFVELCKECGCQIREEYYPDNRKMMCPNCGSPQSPLKLSSNYQPYIDDLKRVIRWNLETGEYKQHINKKARQLNHSTSGRPASV